MFVSYAHGADRDYADRLARHLGEAGVPVWFDRNIVVGDRWRRLVPEMIDKCAAFVVVMTPAARASEWVAREIAQAERTRRPTFPLLLSGRVFFEVNTIHYEDVAGGGMPSAAFVERLRRHVAAYPDPNGAVGLAASAPGEGRAGPVSVGDIPPEAFCFQHREVADVIDRALSEAGPAVVTQVLTGLGVIRGLILKDWCLRWS